MHYQNDDFYQYVNELGMPNSIQLGVSHVQSFDETNFLSSPEDFLQALSTTDIGHGQSFSNSDSPAMFGQFHLPVHVSHELCDNDVYAVHPHHVELAQYGQASYTVPLDSTVPAPQYFDTSQTGYMDPSTYYTDWDAQMYLNANPQDTLHISHIDTGTLNFNTPNIYVKQRCQELGNLPTSGYHDNQPFKSASHGCPNWYDISAQVAGSQVERTTLYPPAESTGNTLAEPYVLPFSQDPSLSYPVATSDAPNIYPSSLDITSAQAVESAFNFQMLPLYPPGLTCDAPIASASYSFNSTTSSGASFPPPNVTSPLLYPALGIDEAHSSIAPCLYLSQENLDGSERVSYVQPGVQEASMPQYPFTKITWASSTNDNNCVPVPPDSRDPSPASSFPSPPFPMTPRESTPSSPILIHSPSHQHREHLHQSYPLQKLVRCEKKAPIIPVKVPGQRAKPLPYSSGCRRSPNKRATVRNRRILSYYFPTPTRSCRLCGHTMEKWRVDRALEHLVHSHVFQVLVETEEQFGYARAEMDRIRCSYCVGDKSLVVRKANIRSHLLKGHKRLSESEREEEIGRLNALIPLRTDWYSYADQFLSSFPFHCHSME